MILPPPSPSPDRGVRCGGWWWRGGRDAVEVVLGYLFFRSDCLAVREPAPEGAWLAVPGPGWRGGGWGAGEGAPGCFASGVVFSCLRKFPRYRCWLISGEGRGVSAAGIAPVPLKSVFILSMKSPLPLCSRPRVSLGTCSPWHARYLPGFSEACFCALLRDQRLENMICRGAEEFNELSS